MRPRISKSRGCLCRARALLVSSLILASTALVAHETDNFYLPLDRELADVGDFLESVHTLALERAVDEVNAEIEKALKATHATTRAALLEKLHAPEALAQAFHRQFSHPMIEDSQAEQALRGPWSDQRYGPRAASAQNLWMNFSSHMPLDLRRWTMLTQSRTVKAYGVYFGTDKLVHFHHLGESYYRKYRDLLRSGWSPEAAYAEVLRFHAQTGILSEAALFGSLSTGVYSNADMAVNHMGFKFFVNLTETVHLKGRCQQPLILRNGHFWRLDRNVRPRSGWLAPFFSDHWNEALNPSLYQATKRAGIRRTLRQRAKHIVRFYTERDGRPNDPAYFDNLARELSTYYGESYGHSGAFECLLTLGNTCTEAFQAP